MPEKLLQFFRVKNHFTLWNEEQFLFTQIEIENVMFVELGENAMEIEENGENEMEWALIEIEIDEMRWTWIAKRMK